jgi:hypothetical protein
MFDVHPENVAETHKRPDCFDVRWRIGIWWNKESEILRTYLKYFSLEKYIGVCRKEDVSKHATSPRHSEYKIGRK